MLTKGQPVIVHFVNTFLCIVEEPDTDIPGLAVVRIIAEVSDGRVVPSSYSPSQLYLFHVDTISQRLLEAEALYQEYLSGSFGKANNLQEGRDIEMYFIKGRLI